MKKTRYIAVLLMLVAAVSVLFAACSGDDSTNITTDDAVIKEAQAVDLIESYSTAELGLPGAWSDYNFAGYNNSGVKVEDGEHDGYYVEVRIGNKIENDDGTLDFDIVGHYLISYDGQTILKYDPENETYTPLSEVQAAAETGSETQASVSQTVSQTESSSATN